MAPLTRMRALAGSDAPHELNAVYYEQRAGAGLLITEGTQVCPMGKGYHGTPGIYSPEQEAGWKLVTDRVHARGGRIVAQLWHVGAISHPSIHKDGSIPVAASAVNPGGIFRTPKGEKLARVTPRALTTAEVYETIGHYATAAAVAKRAGFDGVEVHGAHNYLVESFIRDSTNVRTDEFGGSVANRIRFALAVVDAVVGVFGSDRVGIRLSPVSNANNATPDSNTQLTYSTLLEALDARRIAFVHLVEGHTGSARALAGFDFDSVRRHFRGTVIANNLYTRDMAVAAVESGHADAIAFGVPFLANPDLVTRLETGAPLNPPDVSTFYSAGAKGYTDYPFLPGGKLPSKL
eukprot:c12880_g1_i1.p1 GENE.c12880_g1_i1~~c12880_g1_i1.p1  ORF type:complete len:385 (+),score=61.78 c12880_g1_i1:111-1157(+)